MKRFLILVLLIASCAQFSYKAPPEYTLRPATISNLEFLVLAEKKIEENFPEWYVKDIPTFLTYQSSDEFFAAVFKLDDGTIVREIYQPSWELTNVEDFASILLHEYVHIKIWDELEATIPNHDCRSAVHEHLAYRMELVQRKFKITERMRSGSQFGYRFSGLGILTYCPQETIKKYLGPINPENTDSETK